MSAVERLAERLAREAKERIIFADEPAEVVVATAIQAALTEATRVAREKAREAREQAAADRRTDNEMFAYLADSRAAASDEIAAAIAAL